MFEFDNRLTFLPCVLSSLKKVILYLISTIPNVNKNNWIRLRIVYFSLALQPFYLLPKYGRLESRHIFRNGGDMCQRIRHHIYNVFVVSFHFMIKPIQHRLSDYMMQPHFALTKYIESFYLRRVLYIDEMVLK